MSVTYCSIWKTPVTESPELVLPLEAGSPPRPGAGVLACEAWSPSCEAGFPCQKHRTNTLVCWTLKGFAASSQSREVQGHLYL